MSDENLTSHTLLDIGVAAQIGRYSDGVQVSANQRWLFTSGTPGLPIDGSLPADITGQAELAWKHILRMLEQSKMTIGDVVKVVQYLTNAADIAPYAQVRNRFLGGAQPASMLLVIPQLVRPEFRIEVEVTAAKAQ